jgi:hypothetical protein
MKRQTYNRASGGLSEYGVNVQDRRVTKDVEKGTVAVIEKVLEGIPAGKVASTAMEIIGAQLPDNTQDTRPLPEFPPPRTEMPVASEPGPSTLPQPAVQYFSVDVVNGSSFGYRPTDRTYTGPTSVPVPDRFFAPCGPEWAQWEW